MFKKIIFFVLVFSPLALGQLTTVSGTITDPSGFPYSFGNITATLIISNTPHYTSTGFLYQPPSGSVGLDANGSFVMTLADVNQLTPSGGTWTFHVCSGAGTVQPAVGTGPVCFDAPGFIITGAAVNISSQLSSASVKLTHITTGGGGGGGGGAFTIGNTPCGSTPTCLQWVDDDATDNCGTATSNFLALINSYSGPGQPQVTIAGSSTGKAYKFATAGCHLEFDIPTTIHLFATIDCAQPAPTTNCIQFGATGQSGYTNAQIFKYQLEGGGTLVGGVNLSNAGIELEAGTVNHLIVGLNFKNFGATNATLGNCTNYAILIDNPIAQATITNNQWQVTDTGTGRCAFANLHGAGAGTNTIFFVGNTIGGQNANNLAGCSSQAIIDGGSYGSIASNIVYAFGVSVRLAGGGHRVTSNAIDSAGCSANGVNAAIQWGASGSGTNINSVTIINNVVQFGGSHTQNFFQKAGDSTAPISDVALIGNLQAINSQPYATPSPLLVGGNPSCGINGAVTTNGTLCYEYGNTQIQGVVTCGNTSTGWQLENLLAGCASSAQTANLANTLLYTPPSTVTKAIVVDCQILLTTAATTSSTLPQCLISYTDAFTNTVQTITATPTWAAGTVGCSGSTTNTVGNSCQGSTGVIAPKQGTPVNYSTTGYASVGGMQYQAFVRAVAQ